MRRANKPGFSSIAAIINHLLLLGLKVEANEITKNVLLPEQDESCNVEFPEVENSFDEYSSHLQKLLLGIQQIMRDGKAGYYFLSGKK